MGTTIEDMQVGCLWQGDYILTASLSGFINYLDRSNTSKPIRVLKVIKSILHLPPKKQPNILWLISIWTKLQDYSQRDSVLNALCWQISPISDQSAKIWTPFDPWFGEWHGDIAGLGQAHSDSVTHPWVPISSTLTHGLSITVCELFGWLQKRFHYPPRAQIRWQLPF